MRFAGLITAAGLSSRMDGFKPLMKLNGFPMAAMAVQSMKNAGISEITVVVGYRGQEVCEALAGMGVSVVRNEQYASTDMLASVKLGLARLEWADGVFFLPVDVPMTSPAVFGRMMERIPNLGEKCQALIPFVEEADQEPGGHAKEDSRMRDPSAQAADQESGEHAKKDGRMREPSAQAAAQRSLRQIHPPLILRAGWGDVMSYEGNRGLGGALAGLRSEKVVVACEDASEDADCRAEFEVLEKLAKARRGVSREVCEALYEETSLPDPIRQHCRAVGDLAGWMAEQLDGRGAFLDVELCRSGGYLHDLLRLEAHHAEAAGNFLEEKGYLALAEVVRAHMGFKAEADALCGEGTCPGGGTFAEGAAPLWTESAVVCLADKLLQGTRRVTIDERYRKAFTYGTVKPKILRDIRICHRLIGEFEVMTGEKL